MPPEKLEKRAITLLGSEHVKPKLLSALSDALGSAGLAVAFRDMVLETSNVLQLPGPIDERAAKQEGLILDVFEDALKRAVGSQLELLFSKLTSSSLKGILPGAGVTAIIQSSSATSVMLDRRTLSYKTIMLN